MSDLSIEHWIVEEDAEEARLDRHVADRFPDLSRTRVQEWIKAGAVQVDGVVRKASFRVETGMKIALDRTIAPAVPEHSVGVVPQDIPLTIVYEDDRIVVIDKPAGLTVHPGAGCHDGTLANALAWRYGTLSGCNGANRPGIVHRLDRDTSGLLVIARDDDAHRGLAAQLQDRSLTRVYHALVWGCPDAQRIDAPIGRDPDHRTRMAVVPDGRPAATKVAPLRSGNPASLVECRLETGRTHQIRVHLAHIGHPVVGDPVYGGDASRLGRIQPMERTQARAMVERIARQCLHACEIRFIHPNGQEMSFRSERPADFQAAVDAAFPET